MSGVLIVGVDPGPTTGIATMRVPRVAIGTVRARQVPASETCGAVVREVDRWTVTLPDDDEPPTVVLAVEAWAMGARSVRTSQAAGQTTRDLIGALHALADERGWWWVSRRAAEVKPWATDRRINPLWSSALRVVGPKRGPHARDALRHALFAAVHGGHLIDPLSRRAGGTP